MSQSLFIMYNVYKPDKRNLTTGLLRQLSLLDGSVSSGKHRSDLKEAASQKAHGPLFGMKRDLLQLISSLLYHCTRNQDKVQFPVGFIVLENLGTFASILVSSN